MNLYQEIPKAELHLHLRGAMPVDTFLQQLDKYPPNEIIQEIPRERRDNYIGNLNVSSFLYKNEYTEKDVKELEHRIR